ncbi:UvrD-helicase domain-containing protein [Actinokineospora sp.]|uniref:UvrD-helicase domain-containing protein n=1 Tax=Actinokineospora sp. TaxID=1872133 RepID=UPI004037FC34
MPRLSIAKDFLPGYTKLEKSVQKAVLDALGKFAEHTHAGLHLEKLRNPKDSRIRTIRITEFWRGVVLAQGNGEDYLLVTVLPHDKANAYAVSRKFSVNMAIGVLEVRDQDALDSFGPALRQVADATETRLFDAVNDTDLIRLGIDREVLPLVRLLTAENHLTALATLLPEPQYNALLALAMGMTPEEAWQEISAYLADAEAPAEIDPDDLATAIERTPDRYATVSGPDELAEILAHPFAAWRTFLHPRQRRVAYRASHRGPVLVSGGAGTGKTVAALHRAAFLAQRLPVGTGAGILLTTFTRNLADALADQLRVLVADDAVRARIEVVNVDRLAYQVVSTATGTNPEIVAASRYTGLWQSASASVGGTLTPSFLQREWEQVILAQALPDRDAYLACERKGRGRPINAVTRGQAWTAISAVLDNLRQSGQRTHLQVANDAADILAEGARARYRHVLVDEGQDLHPAQWRLLRRAVASGPDDLFVVSDPHQRIYDNRVSLAALGIEVRGRSSRLTVSYRTTQEILAWSVRMLGGKPAEGLDDTADALDGYRSPMHGGRPVIRGFPDWATELAAIVEQVRTWLAAGVEAHAIGVTARTSTRVKDIRAALDAAAIANATRSNADAVQVGTMHGMKGMEFRCVAVAGIDAGSVPATAAITPRAEDPTAYEQDTQRERCLLFVACTRARDALHVSYSGAPSHFLT